MAQLVQFLLLLLLPNTAFAYFGQQGLDTDSSSVISQSTFTSLLNSGYQVFLGVYYNGALVSNPNTYSGIGAGYVSNGVTNIVNARKVFTNTRVVDALHVPKYATPVANVKLYIVNGAFYWGDNIYVQARYAIDQLNSAVSKAHLTAGIGRTWVVISQSANSGWSASTTANQQFFTEFASYFPALGPQLGVVSTQADFQAIFGSTYQPVDGNGNALPLLLADCQAPQDSGSYFTAFNGWSTPAIHRYQCGVSNINGNGITGNLDYY